MRGDLMNESKQGGEGETWRKGSPPDFMQPLVCSPLRAGSSSGQMPGAVRRCTREGESLWLPHSLPCGWPDRAVFCWRRAGESPHVTLGIMEACDAAQSWLQYQPRTATFTKVLLSLKLSPSHQKRCLRKSSPFYHQNKDGWLALSVATCT